MQLPAAANRRTHFNFRAVAQTRRDGRFITPGRQFSFGWVPREPNRSGYESSAGPAL